MKKCAIFLYIKGKNATQTINEIYEVVGEPVADRVASIRFHSKNFDVRDELRFYDLPLEKSMKLWK